MHYLSADGLEIMFDLEIVEPGIFGKNLLEQFSKLFVADSGMDSGENRKELAPACGKDLLATRTTTVKEVGEDALSKGVRYVGTKDNRKAKKVVAKEGERRRLYFFCYNPKYAYFHAVVDIQKLYQESFPPSSIILVGRY